MRGQRCLRATPRRGHITGGGGVDAPPSLRTQLAKVGPRDRAGGPTLDQAQAAGHFPPDGRVVGCMLEQPVPNDQPSRRHRYEHARSTNRRSDTRSLVGGVVSAGGARVRRRVRADLRRGSNHVTHRDVVTRRDYWHTLRFDPNPQR